MQTKYVKAVNSIQDLFHELGDEGKLSSYQISKFNEAQKVLVNFNQWVTDQINGNQKIELPWKSDAFAAKWLEWKKHHKQKTSKNYTPMGEQKALSNLFNISNQSEQKAIINIDYSISNNWSGVYEYKPSKQKVVNKSGNRPGQKITNQKPKNYEGW
ncbi:hypothetical protein [Plebeiibacterium sediminum]|uniref:Uncharacterized protein n=1 Tax=Plebeiibacterium sediminum TaxID=2992112 RepID=A0AAE3M0M3_9BACT|nr:hypothetical protein [Plebeiobacterium sediminum]MCW3784904.1 hypothetical protein [Plebeiobacterium sediminum]